MTTRGVFDKLFFSFALVLFAGMAALYFLLPVILHHSPIFLAPDLRSTVGMLRLGIAAVFLLCALAMAFVAASVARRFGRGLDRISLFAGHLAAGEFTASVNEGNLREIAAAARALEAAAARLQKSFDSLERTRRQLTAVLDSMQEGVIAIDAEGQVDWFNKAIRGMAFTPVQAGRALVNSVRDPDVLSSVGAALTLREVRRARATSIAPGKTFAVNAAPMPGGGAVAVLHDVSEIERAETTRRDFVTNVSHELRTPLTCIIGYVETLLDDRSLDAQAREFLLVILKNASRMNRLTEDLLALASVESGDYKLHLQPSAAAALVEDAVASLAGLILDSDLVLEAAETVNDCVSADADALNQVFGNLVENAMKYGKDGGRIRVGARRAGAFVEFYVQDFGSGIAYEHLTRIFERFYRVDKTRSREAGGTGLGLAIAKHIVHAHGGDIRCESELGSGATFLFRLPALPPVAETPAPLSNAQALLGQQN
jgi:two-component system, OmpR family, phosphate regulon sensor histidine kinase PhoR